MKYTHPITHVDDVVEPLVATMFSVSSEVVNGLSSEYVPGNVR